MNVLFFVLMFVVVGVLFLAFRIYLNLKNEQIYLLTEALKAAQKSIAARDKRINILNEDLSLFGRINKILQKRNNELSSALQGLEYVLRLGDPESKAFGSQNEKQN